MSERLEAKIDGLVRAVQEQREMLVQHTSKEDVYQQLMEERHKVLEAKLDKHLADHEQFKQDARSAGWKILGWVLGTFGTLSGWVWQHISWK
jgi:hypothetical protein